MMPQAGQFSAGIVQPKPQATQGRRRAESIQGITPYHARQLAWELTRRRAASEDDRLSQSLFDASVGLNPHQIGADVLEYVPYTQRHALTTPFAPSEAEQTLYEHISTHLQRDFSYGFPQQQKHLVALVLRKLLASSTVVAFSGGNPGPAATGIYQRWLARHTGTDRVTGSPAIDRRTALIDEFREHADIQIATEAAAEGVNLQFCSLVVNDDLPWNPQRVEQRIGHCHRYGQRFGVVVINFF